MLNFLIGFLVCWLLVSIFAVIGEAKDWYMKDFFWWVLAFPIVLPVYLITRIIRLIVVFIKKVKRCFGG